MWLLFGAYPATAQNRFELPQIDIPDIGSPEAGSVVPRGRDPWSVVRPQPSTPSPAEKTTKVEVPDSDLCTKSEDTAAALAACTRIIDGDSANEEQLSLAFLGRARIHHLQHDKIGTLTDLGEAIRLNPRSPLPVYRRGRIWLEERNFDLAIKDLTSASNLAPRNAAILLARATAYRGKGDLKRAVADLSRAIEIDRKSDRALYERAITYLALDDRERARNDLNAALAANPKSGIAFLGLGHLNALEGKLSEALQNYDSAIAFDPSLEGAALQKKGSARQNAGDCFGAIHDYTRALALGAGSAQTYKARGICLREIDALEESLADLNRAIVMTPKDFEILAERGATHLLKKDNAAALKDFDLALKADPSLQLALRHRAKLRLLARQPRLALADFDSAIGKAPSGDLLAERAWAHILLYQHDHARRDIAQALALDGKHPIALLAQGYIKMASGDRAGATEDYVQATQRDPKAFEFVKAIGIDLSGTPEKRSN